MNAPSPYSNPRLAIGTLLKSINRKKSYFPMSATGRSLASIGKTIIPNRPDTPVATVYIKPCVNGFFISSGSIFIIW